MRKLFEIKGLYWPFFFCALGFFYLLLAPTTVQFGDTSEFATNGFLFRLSHPPGYPLFTYLTWIFTHLIPFGTVFFKASFLQIILAVGTLVILRKSSKANALLLSLALASFAFGRLFWRYALLPDVFMLNLFLVSLYFWFFFKEKTDTNFFLSSLIYGLALANHQTAIFIFPLYLYQCWESRKIKVILKSFLILSLTMGSCYLSLFFLDDQSFGSWGQLKSIDQLLHHILRKDYGTFTLSNAWSKETYLLENTGLFLKLLFLDYFTFVFIGCLIFSSLITRKIKLDFKDVLFLFITILSFITFFYLSNVSPIGASGLLMERFYLFPLGMFCFWIFKTLPQFESRKLTLTFMLVALVNCGLNLYRYIGENNFRQDTFLQTHYTYLLEKLPKDSIFLIAGDTHVFSLYYIQEVLNYRKDVTIIAPPLFVYPWYRNKIQKLFPDKNLSEFNIASKLLHKNIDSLIIAPNIEKHRVFIDSFLVDHVDFENYHVIHEGIFMEIKKGKSASMFDCKRLIALPPLHDVTSYQANLEVFHWYGSCDYFGGVYHLKQRNKELSLYMFKRAMEKVPYSKVYHRAYCEALEITLSDPLGVKECFEELKEKNQSYSYRID